MLRPSFPNRPAKRGAQRGVPRNGLALPVVFALVMLLLGLAAPAIGASELTLLSVTQPRPGQVVARVSYTGATAPQPAEIALRLDPAGGPAIPAASVVAVPAGAAPAAVLICVDRSGSMGAAALASVQRALRESLTPSNGAARLPYQVGIVAFGTRSTHLLGLTSDPAQIAAAVAKISVERERDGKTRLHDAVAGGLAELRGTEVPAKRLLVVSDGNDEGSAISQTTLIERAAAPPAVAIDAVGFGALASSSSGSLSTLAGATGGRFAVAANGAELTATLGRMVRQSASVPQFDVAFQFAPAADGRSAPAPVLEHRPAGGTVSVLPVGVNLVAAAGPAAAVPASGGSHARPAEPSMWAGLLTNLRHGLSSLPLWAWVGAGLLLLMIVLAVVAWLSRRRSTEAPAPAPSEQAWTPPRPGPTIIGTPTAAPPPPTPATAPASPARRGDRPTVIGHVWPLPGGGTAVAQLQVTAGPMKGRRFDIVVAQTRLGSADDNDIALTADEFVSGHHAVVRAEASRLYLVDLGSTNGCDLNGERFRDSTRSLSPGDRITVGHSTLEVSTADALRGRPPAFEQRVR